MTRKPSQPGDAPEKVLGRRVLSTLRDQRLVQEKAAILGITVTVEQRGRNLLWIYRHREGIHLVTLSAKNGSVVDRNNQSLGKNHRPLAALELARQVLKGDGASKIRENLNSTPNGSENAQTEIEQVEQDSQDKGLELKVSQIKARKLCLHWMWDHPDLGRVLNWWPNTGHWQGCGQTGEEIHSPYDALDLAVQLVQGVLKGDARLAFR